MPPKRKRADDDSAAASAVTPDNKVGAGLKSILAAHTCSITCELMIEPVFAEDGHIYEKAAITRWLATHSTSPKTNAPMGNRLTNSVSAKQTIASVMEMEMGTTVVDDEAAMAWHLGKGVSLAKSQQLGDALVHLRRAEALGSRPAEIQIMGINLAEQTKTFRQLASDEGVDVSHLSFGSHAPASAVMTSWKRLRTGQSRVRILDDAAKVKRLCDGIGLIRWDDSKAQMCGKVHVVTGQSADIFVYVLGAAPNARAFPFDACILVEE